MKKIGMLSLVGIVIVLLIAGCAYDPHRYNLQRGAVIGAVAGGIAGQLIGHNAAGTYLGATIGTIVGGTVGTVMDQQREAIIAASRSNERVVIPDNQGGFIEAIPGPINQRTNCKKVTTRHWEDGVMKEKIHEVCTGKKITDTY